MLSNPTFADALAVIFVRLAIEILFPVSICLIMDGEMTHKEILSTPLFVLNFRRSFRRRALP